jgi:hypothetical protein
MASPILIDPGHFAAMARFTARGARDELTISWSRVQNPFLASLTGKETA